MGAAFFEYVVEYASYRCAGAPRRRFRCPGGAACTKAHVLSSANDEGECGEVSVSANITNANLERHKVECVEMDLEKQDCKVRIGAVFCDRVRHRPSK